MNEIFAHRALYKSREHSLEGIKNYVESGIGLELDLRYGKNGIYMSHDISDTAELLKDAWEILSGSKCKTIFHIKEMQVIEETIQLLKQYSIKNCVLYNTDGKNIPNENFIEIGFYANKFPNNVNEKILWCDETNERWFNRKTILELQKQNKILFAHSLELIQQSTFTEIENEWSRINEIGFDGICTNFPIECSEFYGENK